MKLPDIIEIDAHEFSSGQIGEVSVPVSAEYSFIINLNNSPFVSIACSGTDLEHLVTGHLVTEGIIKKKSDIQDISIDFENFSINVTTSMDEEVMERLFRVHSIASGCGQGRMNDFEMEKISLSSIPHIDSETITSSMKRFLRSSETHKKTRGVHSAVLLSSRGEEIVFFDEIGRHNAVDKIIGYAADMEIPLDDKMILSTGRLSSEIALKAIHASVPFIISKASPTSLSVKIARDHNLVLIGKVRGSTFCIFNGREFIKL